MLDYKLRRNYKRNLEWSLIISFSLIIILFYFFPRKYRGVRTLPPVPSPTIKVVDIPQTIQHYPSRSPRPILPVIPVASEEPDILEDAMVDYNKSTPVNETSPVLSVEEVSELSSMPRQVLEVVPRAGESISGIIQLSLRIGKDGKVKEYKVLSNTTSSDEVLQEVLRAVKQSMWEPVVINNVRYEYWIEKTYKFN